MDMDSESKLMSLFTQLFTQSGAESKLISHIVQIISVVSSLDYEKQSKPESEFMSLIIQIKSLVSSMDLDSQPEPISKVISFFNEIMNHTNSYSRTSTSELFSLIRETFDVEPEPELISLIYPILSLVVFVTLKDENLISLRPQAQVRLGEENRLYMNEEVQFPSKYNKLECLPVGAKKVSLTGEGTSSYFFCEACMGQNHERYEQAPVEIKHPLHPKHSLKLVFLEMSFRERKCYCCDEYLDEFVYCCLACDYAMNIACVEKPQVLSIDCPKRHEHPLSLFSRTTSLICDVCSLADSTCPFYICPPCGFVVHRRCMDLPYVIRISRHPHRISFTHSFNYQGRWCCGVCRKEIHNDYGGYSCTKNGCSYAAHSKCATQSNVWDGVELEGVPEDDMEDIEPFVRISDGIIQHFSHQEHHLRLDENIYRDYDEDTLCQACITPIYFGNLYACVQCSFILHEECANLPRKMYHPIHPHLLTLARQDSEVERLRTKCSACPWHCAVGLFYECRREGCHFQVHVPCGVISEPLVHASHMHHLFLTSKPGEERECSVCKEPKRSPTNETFNCIECEFSLCFGCATLPQKVRYKHDKHTFVLSYGNETSTTASWCEACEGKIDTKKGFYTCDEDCCVILHIKCLIGRSLYMKPGSSWYYRGYRVDVLRNKRQMTRPICSYCKRRCQKPSFQMSGRKIWDTCKFCSTKCMFRFYFD